MAITDWPADERPREKLLARGAGALSDAELLAIFLRTGQQGMTAVDLARRQLAGSGGDDAAGEMSAQIVKGTAHPVLAAQDQRAFSADIKTDIMSGLRQIADMASQHPVATKQDVQFQSGHLFACIGPARKARPVPVFWWLEV